MTVSLSKESESPGAKATTAAAAAATDEKRPPPPRSPPPPPFLILPPAAPFPPSALLARDEGNAAMRSGDFSSAVISYSRTLLSLQQLENEKEKDEEETKNLRLARALALSNRAAARLSLGRFSKASADSLQAIELCPYWWRPWARLARARAGAGDARGGVRACREGSEAAAARTEATTTTTKGLLSTKERLEAQAALRREADAITLAAAHEGRFDGFDGTVLEVRPAEAGSEWLGLPAPAREGESEDDDEDQGSPRRLCSSSSSENALAVAPRPSSTSSSPSPRQRRQTSFRSLHDALAAAEDGDVIRMLPGTHNGLGRSAVIDKRVLIDGRGGEESSGGGFSPLFFSKAATTERAAMLDARGNVPALRFRRPAAVVGLAVDATGFREAVRVDSLLFVGGDGKNDPTTATRALLAGCSVASSGDDGCVAAGKLAALTLLCCEITGAARAGARAFAGGDVDLRRCSVAGCGTHGLASQALHPSSPFLDSSSSSNLGGRISAKDCRISNCREEGALCSGPGSRLILKGVRIESCAGPAVDASGVGCLVLLRGGGNELSRCAGGGLWLWQGARAKVSPSSGEGGGGGNVISCDETFALLTDGKGTRLEIEEGSGGCCELRGGVSGAEAERAAAMAAARNDGSDQENGKGSNTTRLRRHCGPPPEVGPFRWDGPDPLRAE